MERDGLLERGPARRLVELALDEATAGHGGVLVVEGAAGTGRSTLLQAAAATARARGLCVTVLGSGPIDEPAPGDPPLVVVADDVEAPADVAVAVSLARRTAHAPIVLVVATGEAGVAADLTAAAPTARTVTTHPLGPEAALELVRRFVPDLPTARAKEWHHEAGGNPFVLTTLALAGPAAPEDPGPALVRFAVDQARRAGEQGELVAAAVAVLAEDATVRRVEAVSGLDEGTAGAAVDRLRAIGVLGPELQPRFAAPVLGPALLRGCSTARVSALHESAAAVLEGEGVGAERVAAHLLRTAAAGRPEVVATLRAAADHARRAGESEAVVAYLRRALLEPPPPEERIDVLTALARAEATVGDPAAPARLEEVLQLLDDRTARARVRLQLGRMLVYAGRVDDGMAVLGQALDEVDDPSSELALRIDAAFVVAARMDTRTFGLARARLAGRRAHPPPGGTRAEQAVLAELAYLEALEATDREAARDLAVRSLGGRDLAAVATMEAPSRHVAIIVLIWTGELDLAEQACRLVVQLGRQRGSRLDEALGHELLASIAQERGEMQESIDAVERGLAAVGAGSLATTPAHWARLALARSALGDTSRARDLLEDFDAAAHAGSTSHHFFLAARARVRLAAGDVEGALDDALACGRATAAIGNRNPGFPQWRAVAVEALGRLGRVDEARVLADEEVALAERWGLARPLEVALRARATLDGGRVGGPPAGPSVRLLDGFAVWRDGAEVEGLTPVPAALVKVVALARRPVHVEQVADLIWEDGDPASRTRLRNVLTRVRRAAGDLVVRDGDTLRLAAGVEVDAWAFEDAAVAALRPGRARDEAWLGEARAARDRYRGDLLPADPFAPWAEAPRERLRRLHLDLLDALAAVLEATGELEEAVQVARAAVAADPLDERRPVEAARLEGRLRRR